MTFGKTARSARSNAMPCGMVRSPRSSPVEVYCFLVRRFRFSVIVWRTLWSASTKYEIHNGVIEAVRLGRGMIRFVNHILAN